MRVPLVDLVAQNTETADDIRVAVDHVFETASYIGGSDVGAFETEYAEATGAGHCVGVGNGTDALELALRAAGVTAGGEVVLPANTFIATAEAVSRIGAVPVFADVDDEHLLLDPAAAAAAVTSRTQAVVPVHLFGQVAPVGALRRALGSSDVPIVEDGAQSQGAESWDGRAGSLGLVSSTSFYPGKNLGAAGDAGAVTTDDPEIARTVRLIASHGSERKYVHELVGFNSRMDSLQAAVLRVKLRHLADWNRRRRVAAARYGALLEGVAGVRLPSSAPGNLDVWHLYVVRVDDRDRVLARLNEAGIGAAIHYPTPLHLTAAYQGAGLGRGSFPVAEAAADRILSLPIYPHITADQQEFVAEELAAALL
ncbi:DegT/DnrJ/EryC1/StrS family aminotransferase [Leifsonia shinshuensis]|uniref:dTDP-4-amino-4,6-dideoxygalactose transaminase n=1 Tax=Leifsonia shinshuensis TaxID=150026 RepID=A0A853CRQ6_9MICO|nr:dTDP-4-amino-4,6-dideoxygalactose transaminase [Leifsonia shinshuensis]